MIEVGTNKRPDLPLAVVVGAGGLGMAVARKLGGRHRLLLADRDPEHLAQVATSLLAEGHDVSVATCEVTDPGAVAKLAELAASNGPLRTIAHVVGLSPSAGDWRAVMSVDLIGAALMMKSMLPVVSAGAAAVFVSSMAGQNGPDDHQVIDLLAEPLAPDFLDKLEAALEGNVNPGVSYRFAKWALIRLCQQQASAWGARGARIMSVSPGLIATPMGAIEFKQQPVKYDLLNKTPIKREGTMLEIADAIDFLTSDRASFISGIDLLVDGGISAALRFQT